jgi:hypothetical protein
MTECLPSLCECAQPSFYQVEAATITNCLSSVKRLYQPFFQRVEGCECNGWSIECDQPLFDSWKDCGITSFADIGVRPISQSFKITAVCEHGVSRAGFVRIFAEWNAIGHSCN